MLLRKKQLLSQASGTLALLEVERYHQASLSTAKVSAQGRSCGAGDQGEEAAKLIHK
jgi:hypothetical protein